MNTATQLLKRLEFLCIGSEDPDLHKDIEAYLAKQQALDIEPRTLQGIHEAGMKAKQQVEQEPVRGVVIREGYPTLVKDTPLAYYPHDTRLYTSPTAKERSAAMKTLEHLGYTYHGGEHWKPPLGAAPQAREPMSDDTLEYIFQSVADSDDEVHIRFARAIEAHHGIEAKQGATK
jgi:hypothetical protein